MSKKQIIEDLENIILKCNKCPRLREIAIYPMSHICYAEDYDKIDLFMIGRNPGLEDDYSNISDKDFKKKYHDNKIALRVFEKCENEIKIYNKYSDYFGYEFFIMQTK